MLYQQVRPKVFGDVIGNKQVVALLQQVVKAKPQKRPHAIMLHGPSGCGKTTLARIFANVIGCDPQMGMIELNAANTGGVEHVREVIDSACVAPMIGDVKCYLFDESHKLTPAAQEVLLKPTEDIPPFVYYIFCTTDPSKIIKTIRNRCAKYEVSKLRPSEMRQLLSNVNESEKSEFDEASISLIAKAADGCPRQGLMLFEQVMDLEDLNDLEAALAVMSEAESTTKDTLDICRELITGRVNRWATCQKLLGDIADDPEKIRLSVLSYMAKVLLGAKSLEEQLKLAEIIAIFEKPTYSGGRAAIVRMVFEGCFVD